MDKPIATPLVDADIEEIEKEIKSINASFFKLLGISAIIGIAFSIVPGRRFSGPSLINTYGIYTPIVVSGIIFLFQLLLDYRKKQLLQSDRLSGYKLLVRITIAEKATAWGVFPNHYKIKDARGRKKALPFKILQESNFSVGDVVEVTYLQNSRKVLEAKAVA
jgi:hypothetical protein